MPKNIRDNPHLDKSDAQRVLETHIGEVVAVCPDSRGEFLTISRCQGQLVITTSADDLRFDDDQALALQREIDHCAIALR